MILDFKQYNESKKRDYEFIPRLSIVLQKDFFRELENHIKYWFGYGRMKNKYVLEDSEVEGRSCIVWFTDNSETPEFEYKVKFSEVKTQGDIKNIKEVMCIIHIYDYESHTLLSSSQPKISLKKINSKFLYNMIKKMKKRILKSPKSQDDIDDFEQKEPRRLGDNIY